MYKHVVMWKIKESGNGPKKAELVAEIVKQLKTLPGIIKEIEEFEVGQNIGHYGASFFDVSLIAIYLDETAFKRYCAYPEHDKVVAYITSVVSAEEIVDYEV